ncbi:MAG: DUF4388 domain-containing protein [Kiritimatiellae bacterium]|nr:DUF4388 domain-containing protein [Kiritimatiellia bacterium]
MSDDHQEADLLRREELLRMKPDYEKYLELADEYEKKGRKKDAARMIEKAEEVLDATKRRIQLKRETYFLSGALNLDVLIEVMQMLHRMQNTGELVLEMSRFTSHIYFDRGEVVNVTNGENIMDGMENFNEVLRECDGFYHFLVRDVARVPRTITIDSRHLILQAFQIFDERHGGVEEPGGEA